MKKILISIIALAIVFSNLAYGSTKTTMEEVLSFVQSMKNVEYIGRIETDEDEFIYDNCFRIREKGEININSKNKRRMTFSAYLESEKNDNIIYTLIIYINNEPMYIKSEFEDKVYDLRINVNQNSDIKITFNALDKITNMITPAELQILDLTI